jgi:hypothetical protein
MTTKINYLYLSILFTNYEIKLTWQFLVWNLKYMTYGKVEPGWSMLVWECGCDCVSLRNISK